MGKLRKILTLLILTALTAASDYCEAATSITISQVGASPAYSISTVDMPDAAGMELSVKYDASYLEAPEVQAGALIPPNSLFVANTASAGTIRIGIAANGIIKGTGELVSITFTAKKKSAPVPQLLPPSVVSAAGALLAADSSASASPASTSGSTDSGKSSTSGNQTASNVTTGSTASSTATQITQTTGSVLLNQDSAATGTLPREDSRREPAGDESGTSYVAAASPGEIKNGSTAPATPVVATTPEHSAATGKNASSTLKSNQSVLDRFSTYKGARSLSKLSSLFDRGALRAAGIVQSPAIVVSDGKSRVTISLDLGKDADTPSFSLKGANQKSLRKAADNKWELEALPQKGKFDVRLSVLLKGERIEIPLVVIPPLSQAFAREFSLLTEAGLESLLVKPLKNNRPAYDVNSDAKQDYIDDYILVGHWLLKKQRSENGAARKPAVPHK